MREVEGQAELAVINNMAMVYGLAWSPDGRRIMALGTASDGRFGIFIVSPLGGTTQYLKAANGSFLGSADTMLIVDIEAAGGRGAAYAVTLADGERRDSILPPDWAQALLGAAPSPDGARVLLVLLRQDGSTPIVAHVNRSGRILDTIVPEVQGAGSPTGPAWLPGGY